MFIINRASIISLEINDLNLVFIFLTLENIRTRVTCVQSNVKINVYAKYIVTKEPDC
jgi:hypothetical protein